MSDPASRVTEDRGHDASPWLDLHSAALRRYFRRRVDPADVDDLVQEVLLKLQTTAVGSDDVGTERYLFAVARSVLVDRHRVAQRRDLTGYETYVRIGGEDDPLSPERILFARDEYAHVCEAIVNLPPRPRMAFELHRFENMTYAEIAAVMHISRETVKDLIGRALARIMVDVLEEPKPRG